MSNGVRSGHPVRGSGHEIFHNSWVGSGQESGGVRNLTARVESGQEVFMSNGLGRVTLPTGRIMIYSMTRGSSRVGSGVRRGSKYHGSDRVGSRGFHV